MLRRYNGICLLQAVFLDSVLTHLVFQDLAGNIHRELGHKVNILRHFAMCERT